MPQAEMHRHQDLQNDLKYESFLPDQILLKWFNDSYSTSKHLLTLYSVARGLSAKTILEIGFGRSSFVLARAAAENNGQFITCDNRDFSNLLNEKEKSVTRYILGFSDLIWAYKFNEGIDFAFLDYFSSENTSENFIISEINKCLTLTKQNGIIAIHDSIVEQYNVRSALTKLNKKFIFKKRNDIEILSLPYNYGLGLIRKTSPSVYGKIDDTWLKK